MFFGKNNNNNGSGVNVNTNFYTSYSDTALVSVGGWNKQLSVKISPCIGKDANGVNQYAQDNTQQISTGIMQENAIALVTGYETILKPAMEKKETGKVSISMGSNENKKVLSIGYDGTDSYLELAVGVDENGVSQNVIKHKFNKKSFMVGYDASTGSGSEVPVEADLYNFMEKVKACQLLVPTTAHAINYSNATKAAYANNKNQSAGGGELNNNYSAPTSNYGGSMEDFLPFN